MADVGLEVDQVGELVELVRFVGDFVEQDD